MFTRIEELNKIKDEDDQIQENLMRRRLGGLYPLDSSWQAVNWVGKGDYRMNGIGQQNSRAIPVPQRPIARKRYEGEMGWEGRGGMGGRRWAFRSTAKGDGEEEGDGGG